MKRIFVLLMASGLICAASQRLVSFGSPIAPEKVVKVIAKKFEFSPAEIHVKKGEPVVLEIQSSDVRHGFNLPDFKVRADLKPNNVTSVSFTPDKTGSFAFTCDVFCGSGHEDMSGTVVVE